MIKKVNVFASPHGVFGNPAPLGLLGLAVSCAALTPIAFGYGIKDGKIVAPAAFITAGIFLLLFGFGCHLITGLMDFANKNTYGGTIFTAFAFNWLITGIGFLAPSFGIVLDHNILLAAEIVLLLVFIPLTYGFGFFSKLLFFFLLDIDLLYICKIGRALTHSSAFDIPIAVFTALLGLIGLWLAMAGLLNPITGKEFLKVGLPMFRSPKKTFDFSVRHMVFRILYQYWRENAFQEIPVEELEKQIKEATKAENIIPDLFYLMEYGALRITYQDNKTNIKSLRLTANGIDLYEQLVLKKYDF